MSEGSEYVTMAEAQKILGVSNRTIWAMVKDGRLQAYESPTDRRRKLILREDLGRFVLPRPIERKEKDGQADNA